VERLERLLSGCGELCNVDEVSAGASTLAFLDVGVGEGSASWEEATMMLLSSLPIDTLMTLTWEREWRSGGEKSYVPSDDIVEESGTVGEFVSLRRCAWQES
jgi:hypothetical protein